MKQLRYLSPGVLEWRETTSPVITDDLDALVRPLAVTRCGLDRGIAIGATGWPGDFAFGHETFGEVVDVGSGVHGFVPGDRVIVPFQISCGTCGRCRSGLTGLCETVPYRSCYGMAPLCGIDYGGALSDLIRVPFAHHMLVAAPDGLSPEALAGVADNVTTALTMVAAPLRQRPGGHVLVVGGAGVALHAVQCAVALGSDKVVYVDENPQALVFARRFGAEAVEMSIGRDTPAIGFFPITIDATGTEEGLAFTIRCTEYEGLCQRTYGGFTETTPVPLADMYGRNITLKLGRVHARANMPAMLDLMCHGHVRPEDAITRYVPFSDAAEAMLEPAIKMVFIPD